MLFVLPCYAKIILFCFLCCGAERKSSVGEGDKLCMVNLSPPAQLSTSAAPQPSLSPARGTR